MFCNYSAVCESFKKFFFLIYRLPDDWCFNTPMKPWSHKLFEFGFFNNSSNHPRMCVLSIISLWQRWQTQSIWSSCIFSAHSALLRLKVSGQPSGGTSVCLGLTYACFVLKRFPEAPDTDQCQHFHKCPKISFVGHKRNLKRIWRLETWIKSAQQISIKLKCLSFVTLFIHFFWCSLLFTGKYSIQTSCGSWKELLLKWLVVGWLIGEIFAMIAIKGLKSTEGCKNIGVNRLF